MYGFFSLPFLNLNSQALTRSLLPLHCTALLPPLPPYGSASLPSPHSAKPAMAISAVYKPKRKPPSLQPPNRKPRSWLFPKARVLFFARVMSPSPVPTRPGQRQPSLQYTNQSESLQVSNLVRESLDLDFFQRLKGSSLLESLPVCRTSYPSTRNHHLPTSSLLKARRLFFAQQFDKFGLNSSSNGTVDDILEPRMMIVWRLEN
ncbi:uncharacterized protein LOC131168603 [Malania oleifera]|uniref:uncharacterized protein LOC131168603 n=1 Tax=Malania oleifera TaxID=397392 RepID=UPI0025ADA8E2|nr:uncharacterized protein LOC131168603 [Malania oleifera]